MFTSDRTIRWIENLANQELLIRNGERSSIDLCSTKEDILAAETATFMRQLYSHFEYLVRLFNIRVVDPELGIKMSRQTGQPHSFSLTRNQMKLNLMTAQLGVVQIQCEKRVPIDNSGSTKPSMMFSGLVEAKFGTFHDLEWFFLGRSVTAEQIGRHYLTDFIQASR